ncbi:YidH family protein [Sulfobacillus harzensis]|uniref:DUF202 domain-containing protein n=1 Tax=Sulfobacillus harzensis TaxID=2729629 RepID=A0A7Y0L5U8_9FIRM|nr:DUF202 domain-containing protein [Sulfobacillus harzensis]NMP23770.1 DUF202 domain-containing protein [Sulfobacillus harzensis]
MADKPDPRTILANERTFLSWLRTGVSLMAFGFVVSKFDLFIRLHIVHLTHAAPFNETFLGLLWVGAGIFVIAIAALHFHVTRRHIFEGRILPKSILPTLLAVILGILGLAVFFYLLTVS